MDDPLDRARRVADEVLFPDADAVDRTGVVPERHWAALARAGLYGLAVREDVPPPVFHEVVELLVGGCLSTGFTWLQHHSALRALDATANAGLRSRYLDDAAAGRVRGGVVLAGALADPPRLRAERVDGGWSFTGDGPFVSGWGIVDVLRVSGIASGSGADSGSGAESGSGADGGSAVHVLVGAREAAGLAATPLDLVAARATRTVRLVFDGFRVGDEAVLSVGGAAGFRGGQAPGARVNGAIALGVARRCARQLDELGEPGAAAGIRAQVDRVRADLDAAADDYPGVLAVRARGAALAHRAAGAVVVAEGGRGITAGGHGARLLREAAFAMVAAGRPALRSALLADLSGAGAQAAAPNASTTCAEVSGRENIG
ncbi:acyl-CoA dehydrogenase family protein [Actinokineospora bangkokensis]|uniref:Acyl-CoA dehydrogenase/oxidase N-terminal domain-containing protein n=1 Tax=Actinokineospora bangkokensis TaxID=1193682 RepID=A0A1Q9LJ12_9PSEU|nr:acyl-CoA dehydrogenase family protein [Actinokineospora bangkokensis]OLR91984.1 hypothetical protein BJP25_24530 [Actinokineospora bangkokensis]